jgi:hypothetical protein
MGSSITDTEAGSEFEPESRSMDTGVRARYASDGDEEEGAGLGGGHPSTLTSMGNLDMLSQLPEVGFKGLKG